MNNIENKNFVLISPRYFNYENEICNEIISNGGKIIYINDRISDYGFIKFIFKFLIFRKCFNFFIKKYFIKKLKLIKNTNYHVDYFLIIIPEGFTNNIIKMYKKAFPNSKFILYLWDSINNRKYITKSFDFFDKIFTFDYDDAKKNNLLFQPLFYINNFNNQNNKSSYIYDFSFIGTAHSDRVYILKKLVNLSNKNFKYFFHFYLQNPLVYFYYIFFDKNFKNVKLSDLTFKSLDKNQVKNIISDSNCIIDVNHPNQTGLTIRSIEILASGKKLITTNHTIKYYNFYKPSNILIIDRKNPQIDSNFLKINFETISDNILENYKIKNWINTLIN
jgi:hypothetical protein